MNTADKSIFYTGTFSDYLYVMELDRDKKKMSVLNRIGQSNRPAYLCMPKNRKYLYAAHENSDGLGGISTYDLSDIYNPRQINTFAFNTAGPCHISLTEDQCEILTASYFDGRVTVNPINADGLPGKCSTVIQHPDVDPLRKGAVLKSQCQPRAHFICQVPGTRYALATDLGADKVFVYIIEEGSLSVHSVMDTITGAGPRHIAIHPTCRTVYLINELNCTMSVLDFDTKKGILKPVQQISTLPPGYHGRFTCSAVHISADARFLYGANRGHDSICVFLINEKDHGITLKGHLNLPFKTPRDFTIDSSGQYMVVGNLDSDSVSLCKISEETGVPALINHIDGIEKPSNFVFY
jgi:6-phosphogluconolactonase